ncbi:MAG: class II aldolase/adducin family protein [Oscillospiraceae bacterium]|jgi:L-ribulose-5-phosphate 4-epimerase|nr:class II aldolase/adducin family protein [Oscillospiraceae bacterium]
MLNDVKRAVCKANKELVQQGLVKFDWGSVSAFDMSMGVFVIKPQGVPFDELQPELMVVMSMEGQKVEGRLEPASDEGLHRALYCSWAMQVGAIVHTQSLYATAFAQAGQEIGALGSVHARCFGAPVPVTRPLTAGDIGDGDFNFKCGERVIETVGDPLRVPAALIHGHGAAIWGANCADAVQNAVFLEAVANMAFVTKTINPNAAGVESAVLEAFRRK